METGIAGWVCPLAILMYGLLNPAGKEEGAEQKMRKIGPLDETPNPS